jgi:hypothetical protein
MNVSELRDLIIIVGGIIGIIALIVLTILFFLLYRRVNRLSDKAEVTLGKMEETIKRVNEVTAYASNNIIKPLIGAATIIRGISHGLEIIGKGRKK